MALGKVEKMREKFDLSDFLKFFLAIQALLQNT